MYFLENFARRFIQVGRLDIIDARGRRHRIEGATAPGIAPSAVRLRGAGLGLFIHPSLAVGEAYMDGRLTIEEGSLYDFLALASINAALRGPGPGDWLDQLTRRLQQWNPVSVSRRNVAHHYDLSDSLYDLFLDRDRLYSCAYFPEPGMGLDAAQEAKKHHIIGKLLLEGGQRVLDIGCGWGGLALEIAREADVEVTGITLSEHQLRIARQRAAAAGLADRVRFELADYREIAGPFDRIVSVGMFEHVGVVHYPAFFERLHHLLAPAGLAVLHAIGRHGKPSATDPWIRKYIFPGGYCPALSEVLPAVEESSLCTTDLEILRPSHYADTLRAWRERFCRQWRRAAELYDERFCRMWEFYLAGSECGFRFRNLMVFQMQLAKNPHIVPASRNYMADNLGAGNLGGGGLRADVGGRGQWI